MARRPGTAARVTLSWPAVRGQWFGAGDSWPAPSHAVPAIGAGSPPPFCLALDPRPDGSVQLGFVAGASIATDPDVTDITSHGGWRNYLASVAAGH